jgi:hypothetical protein
MKKLLFAIIFLAACNSTPKVPIGTLTPSLVDYQLGFGFSTYDSAFASTPTPVKVQSFDLNKGSVVSINGAAFYGQDKFYKVSNLVIQIDNNGKIK